jgi:hypothetical protein
VYIIDKIELAATIRVNVEELRIIADSIDYMADKHEINFVKSIPDKEERKKLAN